MSNKLIKFRPEWFAAYGLDKEKNFMQSPVCECGNVIDRDYQAALNLKRYGEMVLQSVA